MDGGNIPGNLIAYMKVHAAFCSKEIRDKLSKEELKEYIDAIREFKKANGMWEEKPAADKVESKEYQEKADNKESELESDKEKILKAAGFKKFWKIFFNSNKSPDKLAHVATIENGDSTSSLLAALICRWMIDTNQISENQLVRKVKEPSKKK
jgi:hypothetical protein